MSKAIRTSLAIAAVAFGSLCAVDAASAHTDVYLSVGPPAPQPVYQRPNQVVYPGAPTIYVSPGYGFGSPWEQQRAWQDEQWRQQQWREQQWRERQWRERQWREHEWREEHREHERHEHHHDRDDD